MNRASLFDVMHGTSKSRAAGEGKSNERFKAGDRVSVAVYDEQLTGSPSRLNPNAIIQRDREVATDQNDENAYRRQGYEMFKKNIAKAFDKYDRN